MRSGKPERFFFIPKGALTHHWPERGSGGTCRWQAVRSAKRMRLLRKPDGQCHIDGPLLSLSTQLVCGKRSQNTVALTDGIPPTARTNLPQHKALPSVAAALSAVMTITIADSHFLFHKEKQKLYERIGTKNGNLSFGSQSHQPGRRTIRRGCCGLYELLPNSQ